MPEWVEVEDKDLREGDSIRAYAGEFNRYQSVVEKDVEGDLYASGVGYFTNRWTDDGVDWNKTWERLERQSVIPTTPGYYMAYGDVHVLRLDTEGVWYSGTNKVSHGAAGTMMRYAPLIRLYSQKEYDDATKPVVAVSPEAS